MKAFRNIISFLIGLVRANMGILLMCAIAVVGMLVLTIFIVAPAYTSNGNQLYSSKLGANAMKRKAGEPIPVQVTKVYMGEVSEQVLGEGICASKPLLIPIVPMAPVIEVLVEEGQQIEAGTLVAVLDDSKARIKYESAKLAVSTAAAELERVRLGSAYVLAQERPEVEKINVASIKAQYDATKERYESFKRAYERGVISKVRLLEVKNEYTMIAEQLSKSKVAMRMAVKGVLQSKQIAENAVSDAKKALAHREQELEAYKIYAPASGIVDRVLINAGEYNQDSGKPGFMLATGLWFEGYFDQSDFAKIKTGQVAKVSLESYPGKMITAKITQIKPIVSFHSGGPEISRPLRPRGSGSPEWAATFKVKFEFNPGQVRITPGMTGFARLDIRKECMIVPRAAVNSISAGKALVYVVDNDNNWEPREVSIGRVDELKVEVIDGLETGDKVITEGHWGLKKNDVIQVVKK